MACPDCASTATTRRKGRTALGYRRFRCQACRRRFNERTGTPFNDLQYPTDIVLLAVLWRLRYKLGFRDVAELLLQRGFEVTHETIRAWEVRFAPLLADQLRAKSSVPRSGVTGAGACARPLLNCPSCVPLALRRARGLMRPDPETAAASCPRGGYRSVMSTPPSPGSRTARSSRGCPALTCREMRAVRRHLYAEASG